MNVANHSCLSDFMQWVLMEPFESCAKPWNSCLVYFWLLMWAKVIESSLPVGKIIRHKRCIWILLSLCSWKRNLHLDSICTIISWHSVFPCHIWSSCTLLRTGLESSTRPYQTYSFIILVWGHLIHLRNVFVISFFYIHGMYACIYMTTCTSLCLLGSAAINWSIPTFHRRCARVQLQIRRLFNYNIRYHTRTQAYQHLMIWISRPEGSGGRGEGGGGVGGNTLRRIYACKHM